MKGPALSVPTKRTSGWVAETDPKYARAWLDALPLANSGEAARELYQALYTINRLSLATQRRLDLIELYQVPVTTVVTALQAHLIRATQPLSLKKRQLAEFIRQLHIEMAYGYKSCLQELVGARLVWGREERLVRVCDGALRSLREVLARSYEVYMPYPAGTWSEIHEIYRFAESRELHNAKIDRSKGTATRTCTLAGRYMQIMLLGLAQPYQLPQGACQLMCAILEEWSERARIDSALTGRSSAGHFLIDLAADAPPTPFQRDGVALPNPNLRVLNAVALVSAAQGLIARLQKGESVAALKVGIDCLEEACLDLLQRMVSVWGLTPRRRFQRIRRNAHVSVCSGLSALHFFANGQMSLAPLDDESTAALTIDPSTDEQAPDEVFIDLDEPAATGARVAPTIPTASYRVERWEVRDTGPQGMSLTYSGGMGTNLRVGDLLGLQEPGDAHWNAAVVRWLKSPDSGCLDLGVEVLAADVTPVAVRRSVQGGAYEPAVLLPPTTTPRRPASLLVVRGTYAEGQDLYLLERNRPMRLVRPLKFVERTVTYERLVFAEVGTAYN